MAVPAAGIHATDQRRAYDGSGPFAPGCGDPVYPEYCTGRSRELFLRIRDEDWATRVEEQLQKLWSDSTNPSTLIQHRIQCGTNVCQASAWVPPGTDSRQADDHLVPFRRSLKDSQLGRELKEQGRGYSYNVVAQDYERIIPAATQ